MTAVITRLAVVANDALVVKVGAGTAGQTDRETARRLAAKLGLELFEFSADASVALIPGMTVVGEWA